MYVFSLVTIKIFSLSSFLYNFIINNFIMIAQLVKNPPAIQETPVQFLGREDTLEKG